MIIGCQASFAQYSKQYAGCAKSANTQIAMNICASEEASRSEAELTDVYKKILAAIGDQSAVVEKIRTMERSWLAYRDAYVEAMFPAKDKQAAYGSAFSMDVNLLRAKLTRCQIGALRDLLNQYGSAK